MSTYPIVSININHGYHEEINMQLSDLEKALFILMLHQYKTSLNPSIRAMCDTILVITGES